MLKSVSEDLFLWGKWSNKRGRGKVRKKIEQKVNETEEEAASHFMAGNTWLSISYECGKSVTAAIMGNEIGRGGGKEEISEIKRSGHFSSTKHDEDALQFRVIFKLVHSVWFWWKSANRNVSISGRPIDCWRGDQKARAATRTNRPQSKRASHAFGIISTTKRTLWWGCHLLTHSPNFSPDSDPSAAGPDSVLLKK